MSWIFACCAAFAADPDTLLVLKSGAEVRGVLLGMESNSYNLELPDGRHASFAVSDVDRVDRIPAPAASATAVSTPLAAPPVGIAHHCEGTILVTATQVPSSLYTVVGDVKKVKGWYGALSEMPPKLAQAARDAGGQAVVGVRTWMSPSAFSWASPKAEGLIVVWNAAAEVTPVDVVGGCY